MDFPPEIIDKYFKQLTDEKFTPRSFQREAIANLLHQPKPVNTILKAPTGSGKTETAIAPFLFAKFSRWKSVSFARSLY